MTSHVHSNRSASHIYNSTISISYICHLPNLSKPEEFFVKCMKIMGFLFQSLFFTIVFMNRIQIKFRQTIFLINLSFINFLNLIGGFLSFDYSSLCRKSSTCDFQALYGHYCICLYCFGLILLECSRLMCVLKSNFTLTNRKILFSLVFVWTFPIVNLMMMKTFSNTKVEFNKFILDCRIHLVEKKVYFFIFITINIIWICMLAIILFGIIYRFTKRKNRVHNYNIENYNMNCITQNPNNIILQCRKRLKRVKLKAYLKNELKLLLQLVIICFNFGAFIVLIMLTENYFSYDSATSVRIAIWIPPLLNPIFYFIFRSLLIKKFNNNVTFKL